jgi:hypothetical protein
LSLHYFGDNIMIKPQDKMSEIPKCDGSCKIRYSRTKVPDRPFCIAADSRPTNQPAIEFIAPDDSLHEVGRVEDVYPAWLVAVEALKKAAKE